MSVMGACESNSGRHNHYFRMEALIYESYPIRFELTHVRYNSTNVIFHTIASFKMASRDAKVRKVDSENRKFNPFWSTSYFCAQSGDCIICLICKETITVFKEYNIKRHYVRHHSETFKHLSNEQRLKKVDSLTNEWKSQRATLFRPIATNESAIRASFRVACIIAKRGKPFSGMEVIVCTRINITVFFLLAELHTYAVISTHTT